MFVVVLLQGFFHGEKYMTNADNTINQGKGTPQPIEAQGRVWC